MKRKQGGFLFSCSNAMKFTQLFDKGKLNFKFGEQWPIQGREPRIRASGNNLESPRRTIYFFISIWNIFDESESM